MENVVQRGGKRPGAGRPTGTRSMTPSPFVAQLRERMGVSQADLAVSLGVREKTVWRYEKESIIPASGRVRDALEKLAKKANVPLDTELPIEVTA